MPDAFLTLLNSDQLIEYLDILCKVLAMQVRNNGPRVGSRDISHVSQVVRLLRIMSQDKVLVRSG